MAKGKDLRVHAIRDAANAVRGRRLDLKLSQSELARRAGISRKWISEFEAGKPTAEFGILIRVIEELGIGLDIVKNDTAATPPPGTVDLDALLAEHRKG